jgi:hypothetical protein
MRRVRIAIGVVMAAAAFAPSGQGAAAPAPGDSRIEARAGGAREIYAQERVRPRIRVRPRSWSTPPIYPSPAPYNYPGPNAVRECTDWLAVEHRPSGTVLVPRQRCWWAFPR